jgi:hypothetical protein
VTTRDPNPFELLRLDPSTPTDQIVRAAALLRQRAPDEATVAAIRQAVQALIASAEECRLHELLTHADPRYNWPEVEQFVAAFRRPPEGMPSEPSTEELQQTLLFSP